MECWRLSRELVKQVYLLTAASIAAKDYSFVDQMRRAAISIMNNIAEGFERDTDADTIKFLYIAKASAGEVRSMAYAGLDLNYFNESQFQYLCDLATSCSKMIWGLIKHLRSKSS